MKKVLILSLLFIAGIINTNNNAIQISTDFANNMARTLWGVSFVSGIKTLINIPLIVGFKKTFVKPNEITTMWLKGNLGFKALATAKTSFWGSLTALCYINAKNLSELSKNS